MPFLDINRSDIFYTDSGAGAPLVMLHGRSASGSCWDWHIQRLRDRYRVIAFDSVNHGFSSNSPRDEVEPDRVDELEAVLSALGIEQPILVGQSMGAMTTLRWAARHPDRARAIIATGMGWPIPPIGTISPAPLNDGLWLQSGNFNADWAAQNPEIVERYSRIRSTATAIENALHPRPWAENEWLQDDFGSRLAGIISPVSLFVGADDFMAEPVRNLATIIPHARLEVLEGAHHNAYLQGLDRFVDLIDETVAAAASR